MLSASAGIVNSTAFLASERFVSHMSGAATRIGLNGVSDLVSDALILLVSFIVGAGVSVVAVDARIRQHKKPLHWMSLGAVSGILILVAMAGREGFLGPFDAADVSWGLIVPLSFSMGLLNASVATATSMVVRTTHVTGPATDLGIHLGRAFLAVGEARRRELASALLRGGKVLGFIGGAIVAVPLAGRFEYLTLLAPAALITIATARSLLPEKEVATPEAAEVNP